MGSNEMEMWARIYLSRFKRPKDFDPEAMKIVITDDLGRWDEKKIIEVMKWMQSADQDWGHYPTAKNIVIAYFKMTKQAREASAAPVYVQTARQILNKHKNKLN